MSRLQDEITKRAQEPKTYTEAEQAIRDRYETRKQSLLNLSKNKDFQAYLELEAEMNNPKIVLAHKCSDPVCQSLKNKILDFQNRQRLLATIQNGATDARTHQQSRRASR